MSRMGMALGTAAALVLAGGLAGAAAPRAKKPVAPAAVDWTRKISMTPEGAYVLGNPAAKVRLIEYVSYTCSHCAHYVGEASAPLKTGYVRGGNTAIELRHAVRDRFDFTATLLARCGGANRFFGNTEAIMAAQTNWLAKASAYEQAAAGSAPPAIDEGVRAIAKATGLDALMQGRGYTPQQIDACLTDDAQQKLIGEMTQAAFNRIEGTPSFELNGSVLAGVHNWATLEPQIKAALAR